MSPSTELVDVGDERTWGTMRQTKVSASCGIFGHSLWLCESNSVGEGKRVWAFAHVLRGAVVGSNCNASDGCYIEGGVLVGDRVTVKGEVLIFEGVTIEDDVLVVPTVILTNDLRPRSHIKRSGYALPPTVLRQGATLCAGVGVVANAFIGACALVARDVLAHPPIVGNPGRRIGWACTCGERLPDDLTRPDYRRRFQADPREVAMGSPIEIGAASGSTRPSKG